MHVALLLQNAAEGVKHAFEIEYCAELFKSGCSQRNSMLLLVFVYFLIVLHTFMDLC